MAVPLQLRYRFRLDGFCICACAHIHSSLCFPILPLSVFMREKKFGGYCAQFADALISFAIWIEKCKERSFELWALLEFCNWAWKNFTQIPLTNFNSFMKIRENCFKLRRVKEVVKKTLLDLIVCSKYKCKLFMPTFFVQLKYILSLNWRFIQIYWFLLMEVLSVELRCLWLVMILCL